AGEGDLERKNRSQQPEACCALSIMEEKKYIDRLYQEKFKDFEASPRKDLWKDIAHRLKEEERRKPLAPIFWTRIAGVAAVLAFILLLGDWLTQPLQNPIVTTDDQVLRPRNQENSEVVSSREINGSEGSISETTPKQEALPESSSRFSHLLSEISSLTTSGIRSLSGNDESNELILGKTEDKSATTATRSLPEVVLEENLEEEIPASSTAVNRIAISTHAAPIYFGNLKS